MNLYVYDNVLFEDLHVNNDPDYIYVNPSIYDIGFELDKTYYEKSLERIRRV